MQNPHAIDKNKSNVSSSQHILFGFTDIYNCKYRLFCNFQLINLYFSQLDK